MKKSGVYARFDMVATEDDRPVTSNNDIAATGIQGLDLLLLGGLPRRRVYLVQGDPGVGNTTLGLQFLLEGKREGEKGLYITLSESANELNAVAKSHGWDLDGIDIFEQLIGEGALREEETTVFYPAEVELGETIKGMLLEVDRVKPRRVVLDSLSEIRLLAQSSLRYRKQVLALKQFFAGRNCTVLFLDERSTPDHDVQLQPEVSPIRSGTSGSSPRRSRYYSAPVMILGILLAILASDGRPRTSTIAEAADYAAVQREIKAAGPKIRVVNLWATWCGPCVAEMADLQKIANRFPRIALIGISLDDAIPGSREAAKAKVTQFLRQHGVKYRNVYFTGRLSELTDRFNFEGELPVTFVYSSDGRELTRVVGQLNYDSFAKTLAAFEKQQKR